MTRRLILPCPFCGWELPVDDEYQMLDVLGSRLVRVQAVTEIDAMECGISDAEGLGEACADSFKAALIVRFVKQYGQAAWDANVWVWLHRIGRE